MWESKYILSQLLPFCFFTRLPIIFRVKYLLFHWGSGSAVWSMDAGACTIVGCVRTTYNGLGYNHCLPGAVRCFLLMEPIIMNGMRIEKQGGSLRSMMWHWDRWVTGRRQYDRAGRISLLGFPNSVIDRLESRQKPCLLCLYNGLRWIQCTLLSHYGIHSTTGMLIRGQGSVIDSLQ